jgi:hypothetical protein
VRRSSFVRRRPRRYCSARSARVLWCTACCFRFSRSCFPPSGSALGAVAGQGRTVTDRTPSAPRCVWRQRGDGRSEDLELDDLHMRPTPLRPERACRAMSEMMRRRTGGFGRGDARGRVRVGRACGVEESAHQPGVGRARTRDAASRGGGRVARGRTERVDTRLESVRLSRVWRSPYLS